MANGDLQFRVHFDIEQGVKEAIAEGDKGLKKLQDAIDKRAINIKIKLDTGRTRAAQSELVGLRKQLAELTQQWNSLTAAERGSAAGADLRQRFRALREEAQGYTSSLQAAVKQEEKLAQTQKKTGEGFRTHSTYLSRLVQRMVAYASVSYVGSFLTQVRQVTAEFELQRISLGVIIQDQQRANQLFSEIKTFALKSPVKILDLTKYTKQLAAYKIGVDELFETTKRLTDISVGLGVSMDRIVLMYGQIRATGYLRASEVRQATEAGIPLVEELANKLSKANGELVTAADVMDMISKRAISFEMVKEVFDDMTSAGGIFYNMQEKQGNTLYGMWQKLGDAAAVMYDEIGNTDAVNEGMKSAIQSLRYLMLHWRQVGTVVAGVSMMIITNTIATKNNAVATAATTAANKQHVFSLNNKLNALRLEQANLKATSISQRIHTAATISATKAQIAAANSTNIFSKALYSMKAALLSNPLTALAVALTTIIALLMQSESELDKLNNKLQDIERDYDIQGKKSADRFKELVKAVEENVDGSKAQKEALDELDRTYGKILGSEALELGSLKALHGQYGELIDIINAYNAAKKGEEKITATESSYSNILNEEAEDLKDLLYARGLSQEQARQFVDKLNDLLIDGLEPKEATNKVFAEFADDLGTGYELLNKVNLLNLKKFVASWKQTLTDFAGYGHLQFDRSWIYNYAIQFNNKQVRLDEIERETKAAADACGVYSSAITDLGKSLKNLDWSSQEALFNSMQDWNSKHPENMLSVPINLEFDPTKAQSEYEKMIEMGNMQIHAIFSNLQDIASKEGVAIPEEFYKQAKSVVDGNKSFSFIDFDALLKLFDSPKAKAAIRESKVLYEGISPSDRTAAVFRTKLAQLASSSGVELSTMTKYFMNAGDKIEDYAKKIKEAIEDLETKLKEMRNTNQMIAEGGHGPLQGFSEEEIKKIQMQVAVLKELFPFLQGFTKSTGGGRKSDPRLQNLKEEISLVQKLYNEYKQLEKQEGASKAASDMERMAKASLDMLSEKYGISLPTTAKDLTAALEILYTKMAALPKEVFPALNKELNELRWTIEKVNIDEAQKKIEAELKQLAERISRTKTAKEFYEKILSQTGDVDLAANMTMSVYGDDGATLFDSMVEQIHQYFDGLEVELPIDIEAQRIDYSGLRKMWEADKALPQELRKIPEAYDSAIGQILNNGEKEVGKIMEQGAKLLMSYDEIAQKRVNIEQEASEKIRQLRAAETKYLESKATREQKEAYSRRTSKAVAGVEADRDLRLLKLTDEYLRFFSAVHTLTKKEAETLRGDVRQALFKAFQDGAISADELKRELKAIDEQFDRLIKDSGKFTAYLGGGLDGLINRLRDMADEMMSVGSEIGKMDSVDKITEGQKSFIDAMLKQFGNKATGSSFASLLSNTNGDLKQMGSLLQGVSGNMGSMARGGASALAVIDAIIKGIDSTIRGISQIRDQLNEMRSESNQLEGGFWDTFEYLENINKYAASGWEKFKGGDIIGAAADTVSSVISIFGTSLSHKVRKANKEIKRQKELLDQLGYTYGRLTDVADKLFGLDYTSNYNARLKNLEAQQTAYLRQAEAERSKGKKADKDKIKEYENQARDTADEIKKMQDDLMSHYTGTTKQDFARKLATSWIEARASLSDTFAAIKGDYKDMLKNMMVETMAAKIAENAFANLWDTVDKRFKANDTQGAVDAFVNGMDEALRNTNEGLEVWWKAMEARGYDMKKMLGDTDTNLTGIKRDIATASEESINGLAAHMNTVEHYVALIQRDVASMVTNSGSTGKTSALPSVDYTPLIQQSLANQSMMIRHQAETVAECKKIATQCSAMAADIHKVVVPKGTPGTHVVNVRMQ